MDDEVDFRRDVEVIEYFHNNKHVFDQKLRHFFEKLVERKDIDFILDIECCAKNYNVGGLTAFEQVKESTDGRVLYRYACEHKDDFYIVNQLADAISDSDSAKYMYLFLRDIPLSRQWKTILGDTIKRTKDKKYIQLLSKLEGQVRYWYFDDYAKNKSEYGFKDDEYEEIDYEDAPEEYDDEEEEIGDEDALEEYDDEEEEDIKKFTF